MVCVAQLFRRLEMFERCSVFSTGVTSRDVESFSFEKVELSAGKAVK